MSKEQKKMSEYIEDFAKFVREYNKEYQYCQARMTSFDDGTQDLLHQIELGSAKERDKAATKLKKLRKERRISKNFMEMYEPMYTLMQTKEGIEFMRKLSDVLGEVRKMERHQQNRIYIPRVYHDLEIALKKIDQ